MSRPGCTFVFLLGLGIALAAPACNTDGVANPSGSGGAGPGSGGASEGSSGPRAGGGDSGHAGGAMMASGGATATESGGAGTGGVATGGATTPGSGGKGGRTSTGAGSGGRATGGAIVGQDAGTAAGGASGADGSVAKGLTLYYIRHAEVIANTVDAAQVSIENADTFTDLGQRQVAALTTYLQGLGVVPDAVLVSPAPRSQNTIGPYLGATGITGEVWIELNEISGLPSTGAALPSAPKYYSFYKATLTTDNLVFRDPSAIAIWQNDTYEAELLMVTTAQNEILKRYGGTGKTIIVVGHAVAGNALIGLLRGSDLIDGLPKTGSSAVYILNTGVMRLVQDAQTGVFKLDGKNINNPATK